MTYKFHMIDPQLFTLVGVNGGGVISIYVVMKHIFKSIN